MDRDLSEYTLDELAELRADADGRMQELRAYKKSIQDEVDRRLVSGEPELDGVDLTDVGGVESGEVVT